MTTIARFPFHHEAELAAGFLRSAGMDAHTRSDDAGGMEVGLTFLNWVSLQVPDEQTTEARQVLQECGYAERLLTASE